MKQVIAIVLTGATIVALTLIFFGIATNDFGSSPRSPGNTSPDPIRLTEVALQAEDIRLRQQALTPTKEPTITPTPTATPTSTPWLPTPTNPLETCETPEKGRRCRVPNPPTPTRTPEPFCEDVIATPENAGDWCQWRDGSS